MKPKFVTWKKYGFRHILNDSGDKMLCGQGTQHGADQMGEWYHFDPYDERRPLCGTCKRIWEKDGSVL